MPGTGSLSTKDIPIDERLIFALDIPDAQQARELIDKLGDSVRFYKLGLELFMTRGYFDLVDTLVARGNKVFVDLKFFDIPETVSRAVGRLRDLGVTFTTVHPTNDELLRSVAAAKGHELKVLAVTVLTSISDSDLHDLGYQDSVGKIALSRARRAFELGIDGVIASGLEASSLRSELGDKLYIVAPGIRPLENRPSDDQKRVVTPEVAFRNGVDYIVVGRPIRDAKDPRAAALAIQGDIASVFAQASLARVLT